MIRPELPEHSELHLCGENSDGGQTFAKSVRERDVDHFLIEELQASPDFRTWFIGHLKGFSPPPDACAQTERSPQRLTDGRQTDLWLAYYDKDKALVAAVLIESKVADGFRPGQAEAYSHEVAARRKKLGANRAASVLAAPLFNPLNKTEHFDAFIAIDHMASFLKRRYEKMREGELRDRLVIRIDLLEALAGKRPSSVWIGQPVTEKVQLAALYDRLVQRRLTGDRINPTSAARRSKDRFFDDFPNASRFDGDVRLKHRIYDGSACLEFRNCHFVKDNVSRLSLPADFVTADWTGRSGDTLQLKIQVPALTDTDDAASQETAILICLDRIEILVGWFCQNLGTLNRMIAKSR